MKKSAKEACEEKTKREEWKRKGKETMLGKKGKARAKAERMEHGLGTVGSNS